MYKLKVYLIIVLVLGLVVSLFLSDFLGAVFNLFSIVTVVATVLIYAILIKSSEVELMIGLIVGVISFLYCAFFGIITIEAFTSLIPSIITFVYLILQRLVIMIKND